MIDISDPTTPSLAGSYNTPNDAWGVTISGDYAFVADGSSGLQVIDISDPTNPTLTGSYDTPGDARGVSVTGNFAYVADYASGLQVIDVSDPANPVYMYSYDTPGSARVVVVSGEFAHVADRSAGLQVIEIADLISPQLAGNHNTQGTSFGVKIAGDYAYVADYNRGLQVIDITDPTTPTPAGSYPSPPRTWGIDVAGDYAYLADELAGLVVVDISDPTTPSLAGSYSTPGAAHGVTIDGDYAYVADYANGLEVVDISDPSTPTPAGHYLVPGFSYDVAVSGDYAYIASWSPSLYVVDISDPANPTFVGFHTTSGHSAGVAVSGDYAYVADGSSGLVVVDISDPTSLAQVGSYNTPHDAYKVAVAGVHAFVADQVSGLQVIDISDPTSPTLASSYDNTGSAMNVAVAGNYAYVSVSGLGLDVIYVFERMMIRNANVGQSLVMNALANEVSRVRMSSTSSGFIQFELSANNGANWQTVQQNGAWNAVTSPGSELLWRSSHLDPRPNVNPTCTSLDIEWLYQFAVIASVMDIPNDQGRQVRVTWTRSGLDFAGSSTPTTEYSIYRKIDDDLFVTTGGMTRGAADAAVDPTGRHALTYPPGNWDHITTVPARQEDTYSVVVPTLADSTITAGMYYSTFFVSALTGTQSVYFDSPPDSGYSVDNLAPHVPTGVAASYNTGSGNALSWDVCADGDFQYFRVYRDQVPDFVPAPGNLVHMTVDTNWLDTAPDGWKYHYRITAVDLNGNESDDASAGTVTGANTPAVPRAFALHQNVPNPFNPATVISFDVPARTNATLMIYDVSGRLVRTLVDGEVAPGRKTARWDGKDSTGRTVASGVYFYRLETPGFVKTRKMMLLK